MQIVKQLVEQNLFNYRADYYQLPRQDDYGLGQFNYRLCHQCCNVESIQNTHSTPAQAPSVLSKFSRYPI
jgi:hypothetical protein